MPGPTEGRLPWGCGGLGGGTGGGVRNGAFQCLWTGVELRPEREKGAVPLFSTLPQWWAFIGIDGGRDTGPWPDPPPPTWERGSIDQVKPMMVIPGFRKDENVFSGTKMAISRDFLGLRAFSANFVRDKIEDCEIPHPMVKSAARFGAPKPNYGHFSNPAGHSRGKFSSRKTPKMATNRDCPGLRACSANFVRDKIEDGEIPHPMVKSAARFGAPKPNYGHFSNPAGHSRGKFSSRKTPKMAINRDFPGLRAFSANFVRDKIEDGEIPHPGGGRHVRHLSGIQGNCS